MECTGGVRRRLSHSRTGETFFSPVQATTTVGTSSSVYRDEEGASNPVVAWGIAPPATMASGMNYAEVVGGQAVSHTYVVMSTDPEPTKKPIPMTEVQSVKPDAFKAWVPAPSKGHLYYQAIAIVDGKMASSEIVYGE